MSSTVERIRMATGPRVGTRSLVRAGVILGLLTLLAACGGDEAAPDLTVEDTVVSAEDDGEVGETTDAGSEDADGAGAPEDDADGDEDEAEESGGVREHRPPEEAESFADCGSIDTMDPGARIVFPHEEVADSLDAGPGPVTVEVVGCGNTFEANVQWEAYHGQNANPTLEGFTMGGTMGDWGAFSIVETYWTPGDWTVVVFEIDAESGERREYDEVTFSVG